MAFKILLVEDDNNLREIYEARLQAEGYAILTAKDGEEALVVAKAEKPDLIISDVMMPRISGFEMLDIMRNTDELKYTKVIMLTALGQSEDKTRANSLGADRYLVKSQVTLEDIVKAAHELTDQPAPPPAPFPPVPPTSMPPTSSAAPPPVIPVQSPPPTSPVAVVQAPPMPVAVAPQLQIAQPAPMPTPAPQAAIPFPPVAAAPTVQAPAVPQTVALPATMPSVQTTPATPIRPNFMTDFSSPAAQAALQTASPTPVSLPTPANPSSPDQLNTATTAEEKAVVDAQIKDFANTQQVVAPPAVTVTPPSPDQGPMPDAVPSDDAAAIKSDDKLLAGALDKLTADGQANSTGQPTTDFAPAPRTMVAHPDPMTSVSGTNSITIANKKIIHPPEHKDELNINDLLARQQVKDSEDSGFGPVMTAPTPIEAAATISPTNDTPPALNPGLASGPSPTGGTATTPSQPHASAANGFDPNSIAL